MRLVVVGASVAGIRAAEAALAAGWPGELVVIGDEAPYDRTALSKELLTAGGATQAPPLTTTLEGVELLRATATALDPERQVVRTDAGEVAYDRLVLATGARPRLLPGADPETACPLRSADDARRVRHRLDALGPGDRIVVVGAGFIGGEVASAALARSLPTTIVEAAPLPLGRAVGPVGGARLAELHRDGGAELILGASVAEVADGKVLLGEGTVLPADLVVLGMGATPATGWLTSSGIALDAAGAVVCAPDLATSLPQVWAAGDVAAIEGHAGQHWTAADLQGRVAGANAAGGTTRFTALPFAWSWWYGRRLQYVGDCRGDEELLSGDLVLVRRGDRLAGVLGVDQPALVALARRLVQQGAGWSEACDRLRPAG